MRANRPFPSKYGCVSNIPIHAAAAYVRVASTRRCSGVRLLLRCPFWFDVPRKEVLAVDAPFDSEAEAAFFVIAVS